MTDASRPVPVTGYPAPPPYAQSNGGYPYSSYPNYPQAPNATAYTARAAFLRRFIGAMIALFVIVGCILLLIWLILRPRVPDVQVDSLSLTDFNISSSQSVTGTWAVGLSVYNPNKKMSIEYDDVESYLFYRSELISDTRIPPFNQGRRVRSAVNVTFSAANAFVSDGLVRGIDAERARGTVSFNVKLLARVEFRRGGWRLRRRILRVSCRDVAVSVSSKGGSGKLAGGARDCQVAV